MSESNRTEELDGHFADRLNKGWNRQIIGLVFVAVVYAALLYFHPKGSDAVVMIIASSSAFFAYLRRRSYKIYDLMFASNMFESNPMGESKRTVDGIRSGILAELLLHGVAFLVATASTIT